MADEDVRPEWQAKAAYSFLPARRTSVFCRCGARPRLVDDALVLAQQAGTPVDVAVLTDYAAPLQAVAVQWAHLRERSGGC